MHHSPDTYVVRRRATWAIAAGVLCIAVRPAAAVEQFRGVWADAWHYGYRSTSEIDTMVGYLVQGGYNAVLIEVIAYPDSSGSSAHGAFWRSNLVPWAPCVTSAFDPLAYVCQQAHAAGIEVHAWIYPFRASSGWPSTFGPSVPADGKWLMVSYANRGNGPSPFTGTTYWFDAASPDVQDYYMQIVRELTNNYPIDGVHWDYEISGTGVKDNWYPADLTFANSGMARYMRLYDTTDVPDPANPDWADYRRRALNEFFRRCQAEVEAADNPRQPLRHTNCMMTYGAPPPDCTFEGTSSYIYYADFPTWMQNGWLDAGIPMNYKGELCYADQYRGWVDRVLNCWRYDRHVFTGQGNYYNSFADSVTQLTYALDAGADGTCNYSYWSTVGNHCTKTTGNDFAWYEYVGTHLFTEPASTPHMPWRDPQMADEGRLWGQLTLAGEPVDNADVQVGTLDPVKTDGNGYYVVTIIPAASGGTSYEVVVNSGPTTFRRSPVVINAGALTREDFVLDPVPADFNSDGRVNHRDFELLQACATGPAVEYALTGLPGGCMMTPDQSGHIPADLDRDGHTSQMDFAAFQRCWSGDQPADHGCMLP